MIVRSRGALGLLGAVKHAAWPVRRGSGCAYNTDVAQDSLEEGYRAMAADEEREAEADRWSEGLIGVAAEEQRATRLGPESIRVRRRLGRC